jgi:SAM-dependent MidA family methyltransferase
MGLALGHPEFGYYMNRDPFGADGDFITAPEISQMFGELIGVWCAAGWQMMGAPASWRLIELGPGRGTLICDLLRACSVMPGMRDGMNLHLVETSPRLKKLQRQKLEKTGATPTWHQNLEDVPDGPCLIIANEFFDALPIMQVQKAHDAWYERVIGLDSEGYLELGLAESPLPAKAMPRWASEAEEGAIAEISAAREALASEIGRRLARDAGAALIIDYGHAASAVGDTLQAVSGHKYVDILERPGEADITSHVDFAALARALSGSGAKVYGPMEQGEFLVRMGIRERAEVLRKRCDARQKIRLSKSVDRLVSNQGMGKLFKVLAATNPALPVPAPFSSGKT